MKSFISFLLILVLFLGSVACSRQDVCEEKMLALEGNYYEIFRGHPEEEGKPYTARVLKAGDHWVFSFTLPITLENGSQTLHQFEQEVRWSPEMKDYLFDHLSDYDYEKLGIDFIVTWNDRWWIYMLLKDRSDTGPKVIRKYTWEKQ